MDHTKVALFLAILLICTLTTAYSTSSDTKPNALLPYVVLFPPHSLHFDNIYEKVIANDTLKQGFIFNKGHWDSKYPLVTPFLVMPLYIMHFSITTQWTQSIGYAVIFSRWVASVICAVAGVMLYSTCLRGFSRNISIITTVLFSFGTVTWAISSQQLWGHGTSELLLILCLLAIVKNEECEDWINFVYLGICSGLFIMNRPSDAPMLIPVLGYLLLNVKHIWKYLAAVFASAFPFLLYNYITFGNVLGWYNNLATGGFTGIDYFHPTDAAGRVVQALVGFAGQWVSINRGLLVFCPVLVFSFWGAWLIYKNREMNKPIRVVLLLGVPSIVILTALYSCFIWWYGGGMAAPRYLTAALPFMAIYCGFALHEIVKKNMRVLGTVFILLLALSVTIEAVSSWGYPFNDWQVRSKDARDDMWDLNNSLILNGFYSMHKIESMWALPFPSLPQPLGMFPIWERGKV